MAKKMFLAGVGIAEYFTQSGQKIFSAKTLMDSSISIDSNSEDIRGGMGNALLGKYWHTSSFGLQLQDALFDLNYLSLKVGGTIAVGTDLMTSETVTVGEGGAITVTGTPKEFLGGIYGYYGDNQRCVFSGKTSTVTGYKQGDSIVVQYYAYDDAAQEFTVASNFIPSEGYMTLRGNLFSGDNTNIEASSKVGELIIEIPRFQLGAATELAMSSSGAAQTSLDGQALAVFDAEHPDGYFSKIKQALVGGKWYDGCIGLAFDTSEDVTKGDTLATYAIYKNAASKLVDPAKLTFTGATAQGVITASSGSLVTAVIKDAPVGSTYEKLKAEATVEAGA